MMDEIEKHAKAYFLENKYTKWYFNIINQARLKNRKTGANYFERHHILPKAKTLYPQFASLKEYPWNGVLLTAREHFLCHYLLTKCLGGPQRRSMIFGLKRLAHGKKQFTSRNYELARKEFIKINKGESHPSFGKKLSDATRAKMSASAPKTKSAEHRRKIGEANSRRVWTEESRKKHSISSSKKILSAEHRANISKTTAGIKNPMHGTKWIHHPEKLLSIPVKPDKLTTYLTSGWVLGQRKFVDRNGKMRGLSTLP